MDLQEPSSKDFSADKDFDSWSSRKRIVVKNHAAISSRAMFARAVAEINSTSKKRDSKIQKLRYLIFELQSAQPAEITEIAEALGQSHNTTRSQLKRLQKLELVIRVEFETHVLYCLNGELSSYIHSVSDSLFE